MDFTHYYNRFHKNVDTILENLSLRWLKEKLQETENLTRNIGQSIE